MRYLPLSCGSSNFTPGYKYVLDHTQITLPYPVNEDEGRAQFDKSKRRLVVTLPVIPAPPVALNGHADDEDAGNKVNGLVTEVVADKDDCELERGKNDNDGDSSNENDGDVSEKDGVGNNVQHNCDGSVKVIESGLNNLEVSNADVSIDACKDGAQDQRTNKGKVQCFNGFNSIFVPRSE